MFRCFSSEFPCSSRKKLQNVKYKSQTYLEPYLSIAKRRLLTVQTLGTRQKVKTVRNNENIKLPISHALHATDEKELNETGERETHLSL